MITVDDVRIYDIDEVSNVLKTTWLDTYRAYLSAETIKKITDFWLDPELLKNQIMDSEVTFMAAKDETGAIVGLVTALKITPTTLQVARLFVLPEKQRQGIGTLMLQKVIAKMSYLKVVRVEAEENNLRGIGFCLKQGFNKVGSKQDVVEDTVLLAIVMEKVL